jgi:hypothetical protein
MKPIKNTPTKSFTIQYSLLEDRFLDCFLCHKPMEDYTLMHNSCWGKSSDQLKDRAHQVGRLTRRKGRWGSQEANAKGIVQVVIKDIGPGDLI